MYCKLAIVMKSIAIMKNMVALLKKYVNVYLYLDNDIAGMNATKYLLDNCNNTIDKSSSYKNYKDLNDLLSHENRKKINNSFKNCFVHFSY